MRMTNIETVSKPDKPLKITAEHTTAFPISTASFKKADLEVWLSKLPDNARLKYTGISSGKILMTAYWIEER